MAGTPWLLVACSFVLLSMQCAAGRPDDDEEQFVAALAELKQAFADLPVDQREAVLESMLVATYLVPPPELDDAAAAVKRAIKPMRFGKRSEEADKRAIKPMRFGKRAIKPMRFGKRLIKPMRFG